MRLGRLAAQWGKSSDSSLRAQAAEIEDEAMHALGMALHALQDIEAHTSEVTQDNGGLFKSHPQGTGVDDKAKHPAAHQRTRAKTVQAIQDYKKAVEAK